MRKLICFLALVLLVASCSDDPSIKPDRSASETILKSRNDELKTLFGQALANALADSPQLRKLLKEEALKMFNNDYDVLYHMIKDVRLSGSQTVRELLLTHMEDKNLLPEIEKDLPLLTIFVPTLPENTFSAFTWDTDNQIPSVGITSDDTNDVNIVDHEAEAYILKAEHIPAFPVVVVKENERVVRANGGKSGAKGKSFRTSGNMDFVFLADCFDGSIKSAKKRTDKEKDARLSFNTDQTLIDAYNIYLNTDGWHRDFIYYGITPTNPSGPFSYDYQEHIRSFNLMGDPVSAYSKISDQTGSPSNDPALRSMTTSPNSGWTGGYYEFKVRVLLNAKNGIGEEFITYFNALPDELFTVEYVKTFIFYKPRITGFKAMALDLPLFSWDLNDYASTIKIEIEEVDVSETIVNTESRTVKFATNFTIDPTFGWLKKIGLKFGASLEQTTTQTITRTFTLGNDALGAVIVNFADNAVTSGPHNFIFFGPFYLTREYQTGWYSISVEPTRVQ
jgi:hypothetical protein